VDCRQLSGRREPARLAALTVKDRRRPECQVCPQFVATFAEFPW
jgi:hypothetical protein